MRKDWQFRYDKERRKEIQKEFEDWSSPQLIDEIIRLREQLEAVSKERIAQEGEKTPKTGPSAKDYKQEWSYPTKVAFLLTVAGKPLKSEDLDKLLLKYDRHYKNYNFPFKNLTVHLNRALKSGRIKKIKVPGVRALYYALPEWVAADGTVSPEFQYLLRTFD
ncbi:MAG: hypothetical protein ACJ77K_06495 [Bacteroidia bacterium]